MKRKKANRTVDLDNPSTWVKYKKGLCNDCVASCCRLPVEAKLPDLVRMGLVDPFEAEGSLKKIGQRLLADGVLDHFNHSKGVFTLARRMNYDCIYLDAKTRRCTIYALRPDVCRSHPQVGPKPGHCAYISQKTK